MAFINVRIHKIPNATFPVSAADIVFYNCSIGNVKSDAFNAVALFKVFFVKTKIERLESSAFSLRTLIQNLELRDCDVGFIDNNAVSAADRFTIENCRLVSRPRFDFWPKIFSEKKMSKMLLLFLQNKRNDSWSFQRKHGLFPPHSK